MHPVTRAMTGRAARRVEAGSNPNHSRPHSLRKGRSVARLSEVRRSDLSKWNHQARWTDRDTRIRGKKTNRNL